MRASPTSVRGEVTRDDGFALTELLVVVIILGILAAISMGIFLAQRDRAHESAAISTIRNVLTVAQANYGDDVAGYPMNLDAYRDDAGAYKILPGNESATEQNDVSIAVPADKVLVAAARGGSICYYARQEAGGRDTFYERRSVGGSVTCRGDEFSTGAGIGW